jgi:EAL domain-containing protein (putative c-di-GMP-specific phosphodiesterase class I)
MPAKDGTPRWTPAAEADETLNLLKRADAAVECGSRGGPHLGDEASGMSQQAVEMTEAAGSGAAPEPVQAVTAHPALPPRDGPASVQPTPGYSHQDSKERVRSGIEAVLQGRMLVTAFQPILDFSHGGVVGAQALTRFVSDGGDEAADWFADARDARLGSDLEFAALESALAAAQELPAHLYVALKLSAATCLDPLLPGLLELSAVVPGRMVLELTEPPTREQAAALVPALGSLRRSGVRLAIDHAGSYFTAIGQIRQLRPDILKLDRNLVAGIDTDPFRSSLGEAMVGFAGLIGAVVIAQGIETPAELAAVSGLGASAGQGYLLGRPTIRPEDWNSWTAAAQETQAGTNTGRSGRSKSE